MYSIAGLPNHASKPAELDEIITQPLETMAKHIKPEVEQPLKQPPLMRRPHFTETMRVAR
jgi:hypothetical protein